MTECMDISIFLEVNKAITSKRGQNFWCKDQVNTNILHQFKNTLIKYINDDIVLIREMLAKLYLNFSWMDWQILTWKWNDASSRTRNLL